MHGGVLDEASSLFARDRVEQRTEKRLDNTHTTPITYEIHMVDNRGVFITPFFLHPLAKQEFIYSLQKTHKRALNNMRQKGQGLKQPMPGWHTEPMAVMLLDQDCQ